MGCLDGDPTEDRRSYSLNMPPNIRNPRSRSPTDRIPKVVQQSLIRTGEKGVMAKQPNVFRVTAKPEK